MIRHYDVIVIGAGPAGMACSASLGEMGLNVLVLDEQEGPGGQIYRNIESCPVRRTEVLGEDYVKGQSVAARFREKDLTYEPGASVWQVEPEGRVYYSRGGISQMVTGTYIVAATGAMERPVPIPGWTLPGVIGAGGANNLYKEAGLTPTGRVVLAGSGPLLLLEACQLIEKGADIAAILETTPKIPSPKVVPPAFPAALRPDFLYKGVKMLQVIKKSGVPHYKGVTNLEALGSDELTSVRCRAGEEELEFDADLLLLHFGVIPGTHIFRQMGCRHEWNPVQRYWHPTCDTWGRTNFDKVFAAGDGAYVHGAVAARLKGELTALEIGSCLGAIQSDERDQRGAEIRRELRNDLFPRPFVDAMYAPRPETFTFDDDTVLCRCENVTVKQVREVIADGCLDPNEIKIVTRCGMGPCQGRMCGPALAELVALTISEKTENVGVFSIRPPLKGIPLKELAAMDLEVGTSGPAKLFTSAK